jgi:hypothetical protein
MFQELYGQRRQSAQQHTAEQLHSTEHLHTTEHLAPDQQRRPERHPNSGRWARGMATATVAALALIATALPAAAVGSTKVTTSTGARGASGAHAVIAADCSVDVSAALDAAFAALPDGAIFNAPANACYQVDEGVVITHPMTLNGGLFIDESTTKPTTGYGALHPIIKVFDTTYVTLSNLSVVGANTDGGFHAPLVNEAGVKVLSSSHVTLDNITTTNTFGDGLELVADLVNHIKTPDTNLVVDHFTTTNAGRQGVTVAEVSGARFADVTVTSPADSGFDFESDEAGQGSGNVVVSDCTYDHGVNLVEYLTGPITFTNCNGRSAVALGSLHSTQPVSFVGGSLQCRDRDPQACISVKGGVLSFSRVAITRANVGVNMTEPGWSVVSGGHLSLVRSPVAGPQGTKDSSSTVTLLS